MNSKMMAAISAARVEKNAAGFQETLRSAGYEVVSKEALKDLSDAVSCRDRLAAFGKMIEGAQPGDVIEDWPPGLCPPTGWRKESWCEHAHVHDGGPHGGSMYNSQTYGVTVTKAKIVKER